MVKESKRNSRYRCIGCCFIQEYLDKRRKHNGPILITRNKYKDTDAEKKHRERNSKNYLQRIMSKLESSFLRYRYPTVILCMYYTELRNRHLEKIWNRIVWDVSKAYNREKILQNCPHSPSFEQCSFGSSRYIPCGVEKSTYGRNCD